MEIDSWIIMWGQSWLRTLLCKHTAALSEILWGATHTAVMNLALPLFALPVTTIIVKPVTAAGYRSSRGHCFPLIKQPTASAWWNHTFNSFKGVSKLSLQPYHCKWYRWKCNNHCEFLAILTVDYPPHTMHPTPAFDFIKLFLSVARTMYHVRCSNLILLTPYYFIPVYLLWYFAVTFAYLLWTKDQRTFSKKVSGTDWMRNAL